MLPASSRTFQEFPTECVRTGRGPACCLHSQELSRSFPQSVCALGGVLHAARILKKKNFLGITFQELPTECVRTGMLTACCLLP